MNHLVLENNDFLRQFEVIVNDTMARIEYAEQERKIFLTKLIVPEAIDSNEFKDEFIKTVLEHVAERNLKVVPTVQKLLVFEKRTSTIKSYFQLELSFSSISQNLLRLLHLVGPFLGY